MKYRLILALPLISLGLLLWHCAWEVSEPIAKVQEITASADEMSIVSLAQEYPLGLIVTPKTTAELRVLFKGSTRQKLPRVFVTRLPDDFATQGDQLLFLQVFGSLIMRENEKSLNERIVLLDLKRKHENNIAWQADETGFFEFLVEKYDAGAHRNRESQLADLMAKVDEIPVSLAIAQAADATDWGKKNQTSPYAQKGWLDSKTYDLIQFPSLLDATNSYAREMNGLPPLFEWRISRDQFRDLTVQDKGPRFLAALYTYQPGDDTYVNRIRENINQLDYEAVDALTFPPAEKPIIFPTGKISITTENGEHTFHTEFASTPNQRERGLMFRTEMAPDSAMIFINETSRLTKFWMKNTLIPLDMLFFDADKKVSYFIENAEPLNEKILGPDIPVSGVIELPGGTISRLGIKVGNTINLLSTP